MSNYCDNCGCKVYSGACVNCHEEIYIAEQHYELGTWNECSEEFKKQVYEKEADVDKQRKVEVVG